MASHFYTFSPLLLLFIICLLIPTITSSVNIPPSINSDDDDFQVKVDVLIEDEAFHNWIEGSVNDRISLQPNWTVFISSNGRFMYLLDPFFVYFVIPHYLSFSSLQSLQIGSKLHNMLSQVEVSVTSNSESNYTLDGCRVTHPDLYIDKTIIVHGITCRDRKMSDESSSSPPGVVDDENEEALLANNNNNDNHKGLGKSNGNITTQEQQRSRTIISILLFLQIVIVLSSICFEFFMDEDEDEDDVYLLLPESPDQKNVNTWVLNR